MKSVHKYPLTSYGGVLTINLPKDAKVIHVDNQYGLPHLWALVDTLSPLATRKFIFAGTGQPLPEDVLLEHVATFMQEGGALVWHLFEVL